MFTQPLCHPARHGPDKVLNLDLDAPDVAAEIERMRAEPPERRVATYLANRSVRKASFRIDVRRACDNTCAVSGLRLTDGGGRPEVEAAHGQAVEDNKIPKALRGLIGPRQDTIRLPADEALRPHPHYLRMHRERHCI